MQRSFTFHGDEVGAERCRAELVAAYGVRRVTCPGDGERISVSDLLRRFLDANHRWSPATQVSHQSVARALMRDRLGNLEAGALTPARVESAIVRWQAAGATVSVVSGRFRVLHASLGWAISERLLRFDPLAGMRAPARPLPRRHLPPASVRRLLAEADHGVEKARAWAAEEPTSQARQLAVFRAERDALLVRLAADSGARLGELAGLRVDDLDVRVLTIERSGKHGGIGPTKTYQRRRLTLGTTAARQWHTFVRTWLAGSVGVHDSRHGWLFAAVPGASKPMTPSGLTQAFDRLRGRAGVPDASLHRLRHTVGTILVGQSKLLKASARLGHRDPSTTLRHYADALTLDDQDVADILDASYR